MPLAKKIGEKEDLPEENNLFFPTFIYLNRLPSSEKGKKWIPS